MCCGLENTTFLYVSFDAFIEYYGKSLLKAENETGFEIQESMLKIRMFCYLYNYVSISVTIHNSYL